MGRVRRRRHRLGLRARSTVASALGALAVTSILSGVAYSIVRNALLQQRDDVALRQAYANAGVIRGAVARGESIRTAIESLPREPGSSVSLLVASQATVFAPGIPPPFESLPAALRDGILQGRSGRQRYLSSGQSVIAVGVALQDPMVRYVEVSLNAAVERNLRSIRVALVIGSVIAALGGATVGASTSRRVLRPLTRVSGASEALARGGLGTRLPVEDDNDLARLVDSFNRMADALEARIKREARFASDVSHELRTPLAALTASSEVLAGRREELPERGQQALDILLRQLRRFDHMVLDLLEISRLDAGGSELHLEPIPVARFLERAVSSSGFGAIPVDVPSSLTTMVVDRRRLERIVVNLLENARNHAGGATAIAASVVGANVEIRIDDAGPGVPESDRERIFERFARGSGTRVAPGSGLGLAIVAEHVRTLGGSVRIEDGPGGVGARFVVSLPNRDDS